MVNLLNIHQALGAFYNKRLKWAAKYIGVDGYISSIYAGLFDTALRMRYYASSNPYRFNIDGDTVIFRNTNLREFKGNHVGTTHEKPIIERLISEIEAGDVFWDVGANVGRYTCSIARCTPIVSVVAFEPHPENVRRLEENLEMNELGNVEIRQTAISNSSGEMDITGDGLGNFSLMKDGGRESITVNVNVGDDLIEEIPVPNLVKIDVEGAEMNVLRGMTSILNRDECRVVVCEVHPEFVEPQALEEFLSNFDFETSMETIDSVNHPFLYAAK